MISVTSLVIKKLSFLLAAVAMMVCVSHVGFAKTTVVFWSNHRLEDEPVFRELIADFEASNPDIEIDWQNQVDGGGVDYYGMLTVAILGGVSPDVFYVRPGTDAIFIENGWVYDIDPLVQRDLNELQIDDFIPAQIGELQYEGKWWALPFDFSAIGLYFNQDLFDEAGIPYPTPGWSWDDLVDASRKLTRRTGDQVTQWGMHGLPWYFSQWAEGFIMSFGGLLFEDESASSAANHANTIAALELPVRLVQELQVAPPVTFPNHGSLFVSGQAAITLDGSWATTTHREANNFRFDVSALPWGPAGLTVSATGGGWAMAATTVDVDASWKWLKALASHEASRKLIVEPVRSLPPRVSLMNEWAAEVQYAGAPESAHHLVEQVVNHGRSIPRVGFPFARILAAYRDRLLGGELSALEAAEHIHHDFQTELNRLKEEAAKAQ